MELIDNKILEHTEDLDSLIALFGGDDNFKYRLKVFKEFIGKFPLSAEEIMSAYKHQDIIREICAWEGHYRLMACVDFENRKNKVT